MVGCSVQAYGNTPTFFAAYFQERAAAISWEWMFDYSGTPAVLNSVIVGALIAILAASRQVSPRASTGRSWVILALALWTIDSPWVYGYAENFGGVRGNVVLGTAMAVLAIWSWSASTAE